MNHTDATALLSELVSIDSVFPDEAELARFLAKELERLGFRVELQRFGNGRLNVLGSREGYSESDGKNQEAQKKGPVLLYGHMDTVPAYGYEGTGRDPFGLEERDGKLYGLGAYDMKAGIAAVLTALGEKSESPVKVMFVSDEENDSEGCFEAVRSGFLDGCRFALVPEISEISDMDDATSTITLGRRGRVQYEIDVPGQSCHAANLENGISAISSASRIALEIEDMNADLPKHPRLVEGNQFVRAMSSDSRSLSVPDKARLIVDRHLVFPETAGSGCESLQARIDRLYDSGALAETGNRKRAEVRIVQRKVPYLMPYITPEENQDVQMLSSIIEQVTGKKTRFNYGMSVADENLIAMQGIPVATLGPIGGGEHSSQEWVSKKSFLELIGIYSRFLKGSGTA